MNKQKVTGRKKKRKTVCKRERGICREFKCQ